MINPGKKTQAIHMKEKGATQRSPAIMQKHVIWDALALLHQTGIFKSVYPTKMEAFGMNCFS